MKRIIALVLTVVICCFCGTLTANATPTLDRTKMGTITVNIPSRGTLAAYYVAEIKTDNSYAFTRACRCCGVDLALLLEDDPDTVADMANWIAVAKLEPAVTTSIANNVATFSDLELGLYIVVQTDVEDGYYSIMPFAVTVPTLEGDTYTYSVDASPKIEQSANSRGDGLDDGDSSSVTHTPNEDSGGASSSSATGNGKDVEGEKTNSGSGSSGDASSASHSGSGSGANGGASTSGDDDASSSSSGSGAGDDASDDGSDASAGVAAGLLGGDGSGGSGSDTGSGSATLPQTGQLNWPIPVFAICGVVFLGTGMLLRRKRTHAA